MIKAQPARSVLEKDFLEARCQILNVAAFLDRIGRGNTTDDVPLDAKMQRISHALEILGDSIPAKAERIQMVFSIPYDPAWSIPQPKSALHRPGHTL